MIVSCLTDVCESAKIDFPGFQWLTHLVDYQRFPQSLQVICVFENEDQLLSSNKEALQQNIKEALLSIDIVLLHPKRQISFDSEEACQKRHGGDWQARMSVRGKH